MKSTIDELAIFGNAPAFQEKLYVGRPNSGKPERFFKQMDDIFERGWFTNNGAYVREFERKIADIIGVKHCIAMCNGTVALLIAIKALELAGEVIIPSFTFIATAHALQWQGISPVFCDIDPATHNIDPLQLEKLITPQTTGIIGVHLWGRSCDVDGLLRIVQKYNLKILFDAAHAFICSYKGRMIGQFGNVEVFSFHATKFFNTFEGGAVATNDDALAEKIRLMNNHGFRGYDNVISVGINGRMNEVSAAMGLNLIENLNDIITANHRNYKQYQNELDGMPGISLAHYDASEKSNYQYIVVEIDETVTHINRDQLIDILHAENIIARRYFYPGCHRMEPYRSLFPKAGEKLPHTESLVDKVITLPTGTVIGKDEIGVICQILKLVLKNSDELGRRMKLGPKNEKQ